MATPKHEDFLFFFGKNLAAAGILKNQPWVPHHVREAYLLGSGIGAGWIASCMASSHYYALDYLNQHPLLLLGAYRKYRDAARTPRHRVGDNGQLTITKDDYIDMARDMHYVCQSKMNLKEAARYWQISYQLRKLSIRVITNRHIDAIHHLNRLPPNLLGMCIPDTHAQTLQVAWINYIQAWVSRCESYRREYLPPDLGLEWLILALYRHCLQGNNWNPITPVQIADLADYVLVRMEAGPIARNLSLAVALERMHEWHYNAPATSSDTVDPFGDREHSYRGLKLKYEIDGHTFEALNTNNKLRAEGKLMHHCVGTYGTRAQDKYFYAVTDPYGNRSSTLELFHSSLGWRAGQHKAYCNAAPTVAAAKAVTNLIVHLNKKDDKKTS